MTRTLRWTEHAIAQLSAVAEYLTLTSPGYAEQVVERFLRRLPQTCEFPDAGRSVPETANPEIRELIEPPYRIVFRVHPESIEVLSVLHGRQLWQKLP